MLSCSMPHARGSGSRPVRGGPLPKQWPHTGARSHDKGKGAADVGQRLERRLGYVVQGRTAGEGVVKLDQPVCGARVRGRGTVDAGWGPRFDKVCCSCATDCQQAAWQGLFAPRVPPGPSQGMRN